MRSPAMVLLLLALLAPCSAAAVEPYEAAMERQIQDNVLRKFYIDMNSEDMDSLYQPQTANHGFSIEDYFDTEDKVEDSGTDLSRISTEQIKKVLQAAAISQQQQDPPDTFAAEQLQAEEEEVEAEAGQNARDPSFVLSRLLYHIAQLPVN